MNYSLTIIHLYPELMNTYGDRGNIIALTKRMEWRGFSVVVKPCSLDDVLKPDETDIYFFGGGQDNAQTVVAQDLQTKAEVLRQDIDAGVGMLAICGGYQLLGRSYTDPQGKQLPGLAILPVETRAGSGRLVGNLLVDQVYDLPGIELVGFENHGGRSYLDASAQPLARVVKGFGNNGEDDSEGVAYKNVVGTYLHGSLLPKNPALTDLLLTRALQRKYPNFAGLAPLDDALEAQARSQAKTRF